MRRVNIVSAVLLLAGTASFGQNINPTVEVTNIYQGNAADIHKPQLEMSVPDSLLRFDMDFDYEVFDKPYEGAYSFRPYLMDMRPEKDAYRGKSLYIRAGAGYSLHPELEFVYSPEQKGGFQMSVYGSHKSYWGKYHEIEPESSGDVMKLTENGETYTGHDALTKAGFDGRYSWDNSILSFGVGYYGVSEEDRIASQDYNAVDFNVRLRSNVSRESYFLYDIGLKGRFASDKLDYSTSFYSPEIPSGKSTLSESNIALEGVAGQVIDASRRLVSGFEVASWSYSNMFSNSVSRVGLTPRYEFRKGRLNLRLGLRLEYMFNDNSDDASADASFTEMHEKESQIIYPDVRLELAPSQNVVLFVSAAGGSSMNAYSSQMAANHHFKPSYALKTTDILQSINTVTADTYVNYPLMDNTIEKVNVGVGAYGNIGRKLQFGVKGGYACVENGLLESFSHLTALGYTDTDQSSLYLPGVAYVDYDMLYADISLAWRSDRVAFDLNAAYRGTSVDEDDTDEIFIKPAQLSGGLRFVYSISSRIYGGLDIDASMMRSGSYLGSTCRVPGYVDLGLTGGYRISRKFGVWAKAGNLLGMTIQRNAMYAEKGPWGSVGILLNL